MTTTEPITEVESDAPPVTASSGAHLSYAGASRVLTSGDTAQVEMFGNLARPQVRFDAAVKNPLRFREALSALYGVIGSDYRYAPKDRTQYIAYLRLKRDAAPLGVWHAQQAYFAWVLQNDPAALTILDPVVSVHPDQLTFEVFGKDESTYACLAFSRAAFTDLGATSPAPEASSPEPPCGRPVSASCRRARWRTSSRGSRESAARSNTARR